MKQLAYIGIGIFSVGCVFTIYGFYLALVMAERGLRDDMRDSFKEEL